MEKRGAVLQLFRIMHDCSVSQFGMEGLTKSLENVKSTEGKIITISKKLLSELKRGLFNVHNFLHRNSYIQKTNKFEKTIFQRRKIGGKDNKNLRQKCVNHTYKCNEFCDKIAYLLTKYDICVYLSKIDELEKIGSTVSKNSANLMSSGFSA